MCKKSGFQVKRGLFLLIVLPKVRIRRRFSTGQRTSGRCLGTGKKLPFTPFFSELSPVIQKSTFQSVGRRWFIVLLTLLAGAIQPVSAQCPANQATIRIDLVTDNFGDETYWELYDQSTGALVGYGDGYLGFSSYTEYVCVDSSRCYTFIIYDVFGDGMCCTYGNGSYAVRYNGTLIATGGAFFANESVYNIGSHCTIGTPLVTDNTTYTPAQLVTDVLLGSCVNAFNVRYTGWWESIGYFSNGAGIGMDEGVLLTTGRTTNARGPNTQSGTTYNAGTAGDADLNAAANLVLPSLDAASLEFDFVSFNDTVTFHYIFASEEYPEFVCSPYNDAFAFLVTGAGYASNTNIALIPGTSTEVAINSVNGGAPGGTYMASGCTSLSNTAYYVSNTFGNVTEYDGYTVPLTAMMVVVPCDTYHIKLVIADVNDPLYDSGVFLEAQSFSAGQSVDIHASDIAGTKNTFENCSDGRFTFSREDTTNVVDPVTIYYTVYGSATEGTDYAFLPDSIVIPANQVSASLFIFPIDDAVHEGPETVILQYSDQCACNLFKRDTLYIFDNAQMSVSVNGPPGICVGQSATINAVAAGSSSIPYTYLWSPGGQTTASITVSPSQQTTYTVTVTDGCAGQIAIASHVVSVASTSASFMVTSPQCATTNDFDFVSTSTYNGSPNFNWSLGDGNTRLTEDVMNYSYANAGTYNVRFIVNSQGCSDTAFQTVVLRDSFVTNIVASICPDSAVFAGGAWRNTNGTYFDFLTAANGCDSTIVTVVTILQYQLQNRSVSICPGDSLFAGGDYQTAAGTYIDTLISSTGCDTILTTTLSVGTFITATKNVTICPGDSFLVGGGYQSTAGAYIDTITAAIGCDTIRTTNLSIAPYETVSVNVTICPGDSFFVGAGYQNTAGAYIDTLNGTIGCDTIRTTNLSIAPYETASVNVTICPGDSFFVGGHYQNTAGAYIDTLNGTIGCDTIRTTNLSIAPYETASVNVTICPGDSFFVGGGYQNTSGGYIDTLTASIGCDTIRTTNLSIAPYETASINVTICPGDSFFVGGGYQNTAAAYIDTLNGTIGCDTIRTTNLSIAPYETASVNVTICPGDSFFVGGGYQNTAGAYIDTLNGTIGCDTIRTTNLSIAPYETASVNVTICPGDSFFVGGGYQNTAGPYIDTLNGMIGCDTIRTTNLSIAPYETASVNVTICPGDSFFVGGGYQNTAGPYIDTLDGTIGCDTIRTTNLSIAPYETASVNITICPDDSLFVGGGYQNTAGAYIDTLNGTIGCDTIRTTNLTIDSYVIASPNISICHGDSVFAGGRYQTTAGVYIDTLPALIGCDTIRTTNLSVNPIPVVPVSIVICAGDSALAGGGYQTVAGIYSDTITAASGCDSIVVTTLTVNDTFAIHIPAFICPGDSVFAAGAWQNTAGDYYDHLHTVAGCDSTIITTVSITTLITVQADISRCEGDSFFAAGQWRFVSGTYIDTFLASGGCDSIVTTVLTVNDTNVTTVSRRICEGDSLFAGGAWQTTSGQYTDVLQNAAGCDSTVIVNLAVDTIIHVQRAALICAGENYFAGGALQTTSGIYADTFVSSTGCDSILTTDLTVSDTFLLTFPVLICQNDSFFAAGAWRHQAGTYTDSLQTVSGCDSVIVTNLTVQAVIQVPFPVVICAGDSFFAEGAWREQAGNYVDSFVASGGCDSVVTTSITVADTFNVSAIFTLCEGDSFFAGGNWQTSSGQYVDVAQSAAGCDSTITTVLIFDTIIYNSSAATICIGDSVFAGNDWQMTTGVYTDTLISSGGCDSIHTTMLTVNEIVVSGYDVTVCKDSIANLSVPGSYFSYLWAPGGETSAAITARAGDYVLTAGDSIGCNDTAEFRISEQILAISASPADTTILRGKSVQITIRGGNNQLNYVWTPTTALNCTECTDNAVSTPVGDVLYTILVSDSMGCTATTTVQIFVDTIPLPRIYVPNAFTPNGDGVNDEFNVYVKNYVSFHLLIFNRWGEKLFETYDPLEGWNGEYRGKLCNPGVYVYYVDVKYNDALEPDNFLEYTKGSLTLIR